jgi:penicillin-binding protein 2
LRDPGRLVLIERNGSTYILPNASRADNGRINVAEAMRVSSNVFFASIAGGNDEVTNLGENDTRTDGLGISRLAEGLGWFGFGALSGIGLAGEADGLVPTPTWKSLALREPWTTGNTYNTAIGQGYLAVTPLQLLNAHTAVVNGGTLFQPQLVDRIVDANGTLIEQLEPEILDQVPIDAAYLAVMRDGMRQSVTDGLNIAAHDECSGLAIAGKTGTAEFGPLIERPDGRPTRQSHSWFVGYAPYDNPEIAVVVLLEGTGDLNDGSATLAVPAVTQIMQAYFEVTPPEDRPRTCPVMPQDPLPGEISASRP